MMENPNRPLVSDDSKTDKDKRVFFFSLQTPSAATENSSAAPVNDCNAHVTSVVAALETMQRFSSPPPNPQWKKTSVTHSRKAN